MLNETKNLVACAPQSLSDAVNEILSILYEQNELISQQREHVERIDGASTSTSREVAEFAPVSDISLLKKVQGVKERLQVNINELVELNDRLKKAI